MEIDLSDFLVSNSRDELSPSSSLKSQKKKAGHDPTSTPALAEHSSQNERRKPLVVD
jgi:hypothetical protein